MTFQSTKTFGHEVGLTACFRQHRAVSHCRYLHGYALSFCFTFQGTPDVRGWVMDFGALKELKKKLEDQFDHKTLVAADDPEMELFDHMNAKGTIQLRVVDCVGIEAFAKIGFDLCSQLLQDAGLTPRVRVIRCEVREHGANGASFQV